MRRLSSKPRKTAATRSPRHVRKSNKARKNRDAQFGVFVFSTRTAPAHCESLCRNRQRPVRGLGRRRPRDRCQFEGSPGNCPSPVHSQSSQAKRATDGRLLGNRQSRSWKSKSGSANLGSRFASRPRRSSLRATRFLERVRIDREALDKQLEVLRECVGDLKSARESSEGGD